jgi:small-conductance mechanosensitive channel
MFSVLKFIWIICKNFKYLLDIDRNALVNVPDYAKYFSMVLLSCFWALAFGLYVGELFFIGYSMLGHIAVITMVFVTWWVFRSYQERAKFTPRKDDSWLRAPDRSARDDEMSDEQRQQLARNI